MPNYSSADEEMKAPSSSTTRTTTRRSRRPAGGTLRRRRGEVDVDVDSSEEDSASQNDIQDTLDPRSRSRSRRNTQPSRRPPTSSDHNNSDTATGDDDHHNHNDNDNVEAMGGGNNSILSPSQQNGEEPSQSQTQTPRNVVLEDPDKDTMRVMISTDNHVGYAENDNVRGNDSFAALEEVLYLAKEYRCDMVLLAGDLFHENRPTRRTLIKTMDIFRRYCMGPGAIQVQVVSGSTSRKEDSKNHKSPFARGYVNYEDANYSVDLPVFSIHGNHDDPSRDGGNSELFAALDLLDVANLVNYFGKQEDTQNIRVDPILLRKGNTKVALYGLGSMRDERLNRMWRGENLTFSRPAETTGDHDEENPGWFNIFALHQNRDRGRGAKNCIKEDMIPDWIDFVCWGHEHECDIELTESVVGTFRISQPGSSVATSLVEGESVRKKIAVLDVREGQFRLTAIPLTQVRSFVVSTVRLSEQPRLDPDDPKVDAKVSKILEDKVRILIHDAREKRQELLKDAETEGNGLARYFANDSSGGTSSDIPLKHTMYKDDEVLVRLKVDHTGFAAVNNQRFGGKFVGDVANPTSILLFTRKKSESGGPRSNKSMKDIAPIEPSEIEEMNIEELIVEQFDSSNTKLQLFDDKKISSALDSYVGKQEAQAINEALEKLLGKQQNRLIKNGALSASEGIESRDAEEVEKGGNNKGRKNGKRGRNDEEEDDYLQDPSPVKSRSNKSSQRSTTSRATRKRADSCDEYDDDEGMQDSPPIRSRLIKSSQRSTMSRTTRKRGDSYDDYNDDSRYEETSSKSKSRPNSSRSTGRGRNADISYGESEGEQDDDVLVVDPPPRNRKANPTKRRATRRPIDHSIDESEDDEDDSVVVEDDPTPPRKKTAGRGRTAGASTKKNTTSRRGRGSTESSGGFSQSQLSFLPNTRKTAREPPTKSKRKATARNSRYSHDSDDDDDLVPAGRSYGDDDDDWGTAKSNSTF
mmetsp:Transcript_11767/g.23325  ORF Transcript_11767/g.23325 Transcript_11767/m.23325 type:complete len:979 (+) Transcript_11767:194-3130(+)